MQSIAGGCKCTRQPQPLSEEMSSGAREGDCAKPGRYVCGRRIDVSGALCGATGHKAVSREYHGRLMERGRSFVHAIGRLVEKGSGSCHITCEPALPQARQPLGRYPFFAYALHQPVEATIFPPKIAQAPVLEPA
jgi:hypothetical protein